MQNTKRMGMVWRAQMVLIFVSRGQGRKCVMSVLLVAIFLRKSTVVLYRQSSEHDSRGDTEPDMRYCLSLIPSCALEWVISRTSSRFQRSWLYRWSSRWEWRRSRSIRNEARRSIFWVFVNYILYGWPKKPERGRIEMCKHWIYLSQRTVSTNIQKIGSVVAQANLNILKLFANTVHYNRGGAVDNNSYAKGEIAE